MPVPIEAYTADGSFTGLVDVAGRLRDALETLDEVRVVQIQGITLDGAVVASATESVAVEGLLLVVPSEADVPIHATWHAVTIDVGPYRLTGELPTMPGFDPGRALARPTGDFVHLRSVDIALLDAPDAVAASHEHLLVNRYAVDRVEAGLMLGFFFPGAHLEVRVRDEPGGPIAPSTAAPSPLPAPPMPATAPPDPGSPPVPAASG
jgi:hypothetical protein